MREVIAVKNLDFSYGSTRVLKNISFSVQAGSFTVLLGQNGAGKSTLLKLLLGTLAPDGAEGSLCLFGQDIRRFKQWQRLSYVPQNGAAAYQNFPASVEEIVVANLYKQIGLFRFAGKKEHQQAQEALRQVGMQDFSKRLIGELSGGQRQRVLLARALVNAPALLILDEPTSAMDEQSTNEFYELLFRICREQNVTVFMVTHDRKRLEARADAVWLLEDGEMSLAKASKNQDETDEIQEAKAMKEDKVQHEMSGRECAAIKAGR